MKTLTAIEFCFENTDAILYSKELSCKMWASIPKGSIWMQRDDQYYPDTFTINSNLLAIDDWVLYEQ